MDPWKLTSTQEKIILDNSVERVINTTLSILNGRSTREDRDINRQDWEELKELVVLLWNRERDTIYKSRLNQRSKT